MEHERKIHNKKKKTKMRRTHTHESGYGTISEEEHEQYTSRRNASNKWAMQQRSGATSNDVNEDDEENKNTCHKEKQKHKHGMWSEIKMGHVAGHTMEGTRLALRPSP